MKRILPILLAAALVISVTACGSKTASESSANGSATATTESNTETSAAEETVPSGEVTTVSIYIPTIYDMSLVDQVQNAVNEYAGPKYGINYDIQFIQIGNYDTQMNMLLTDSEVDILWGGMMSKYQNGQIADLTDYWENASDEIKEMWDESFMSAMRINGRIYGIPHLVDFGHYMSLNIDEDIANEIGITMEQEITIEEADEILAEIHEKFPERLTLAGAGYVAPSFWTWDGLGGGQNNTGVLRDRGQSDMTIQSIFDNEDYIMLANYAKKWYDAGYVSKDILSIEDAANTQLLTDQAAACFDMYGVNYIPGVIRTRLKEVGNWTPSSNVNSTVYMISANSKHPDIAFHALELLYVDPELDTLFNSGVEGVTYELNEDGTIHYPDGKSAADCGWAGPTQFWNFPGGGHSYPLEENGPTFFEDLWQFDRDSLKTKANGFIFDNTSVIDEFNACNTVLDKYYQTLLSGAVDVESTLEAARQEMKDAGEDIVIAEKQRQMDEYIAANAQ